MSVQRWALVIGITALIAFVITVLLLNPATTREIPAFIPVQLETT